MHKKLFFSFYFGNTVFILEVESEQTFKFNFIVLRVFLGPGNVKAIIKIHYFDKFVLSTFSSDELLPTTSIGFFLTVCNFHYQNHLRWWYCCHRKVYFRKDSPRCYFIQIKTHFYNKFHLVRN